MRFREVRTRETKDVRERELPLWARTKPESGTTIEQAKAYFDMVIREAMTPQPGYMQIKPETNITIDEARAFLEGPFMDQIREEAWRELHANDLPDEIVDSDEADNLPDEIDLEWLERNERRRVRC